MRKYNIKEIKNKIKAQIRQDNYLLVPREKRQPIIMMGPAGIGKTFLSYQVAEELKIGFVPVNLTCFTRPEMKGLPFVEDSDKGKVTKFTMPDIISRVYDYIKLHNVSEGILFLDEINTVADSIRPQMLELLQFKKVGDVALPDGWSIIGACNPAGEINDNAITFDDATRTRIQVVDIYADFDIWKEYAIKHGVNQLILSYLSFHKNNFCTELNKLEGKYSVNPRTWEALSDKINDCQTILNDPKFPEEFKQDVKDNLLDYTINGGASGFLANNEVCRDFTAFAKIYEKYSDVEDILNGKPKKRSLSELDQTMAITGQVLSRMQNMAKEEISNMNILYKKLESINRILKGKSSLELEIEDKKGIIKQMEKEMNSFSIENYNSKKKYKEIQFNIEIEKEILSMLKKLLKEFGSIDDKEMKDKIKEQGLKFVEEGKQRKESLTKVFNNVFKFIEDVFKEQPECEAPFFDVIINDDNISRFAYDTNNEMFKKALNRNDIIEKSKELNSRIKEIDKLLK